MQVVPELRVLDPLVLDPVTVSLERGTGNSHQSPV